MLLSVQRSLASVNIPFLVAWLLPERLTKPQAELSPSWIFISSPGLVQQPGLYKCPKLLHLMQLKLCSGGNSELEEGKEGALCPHSCCSLPWADSQGLGLLSEMIPAL